MLVRHSLQYLLARGIPAIINYSAILIFTRMLSPASYGRYALVIAVVGLVNTVLFWWLQLGLERYYAANLTEPARFLSIILRLFISLVFVSILLVTVAVGLGIGQLLGDLLLVGLLLLIAQAWYELNLSVQKCKLAPGRVGGITLTKSIVAVLAGFLLIRQGLEAKGALYGLVLGLALPALVLCWQDWRGVWRLAPEAAQFKRIIRYGAPLTLTYALLFVLNSSDRMLLGWLVDVETTGYYSVGYDMSQQSIGIIFSILHMAAYPLVVRAYEKHGATVAEKQARQNGLLYLGVAVPAACGMIVLAPEICELLVGEEFRSRAAAIVPWIAFAALLAGAKSFYCDIAFQLSGGTIGQMIAALLAAGVNIGLNLWWIPEYGALGAAYATVVAFVLAFVVAYHLSRKTMSLHLWHADIAKIVLGSIGMGLVLLFLPPRTGVLALLLKSVLALLVYIAFLMLLNVGAMRTQALRLFGR